MLDGKIELGPLTDLEDIDLNQMKKHLIWVNDLSGEDSEEFDESAERPVLNTESGVENVSKEMVQRFSSVSVLVQEETTKLFGTVNLYDLETVSTLVFWHDGDWVDANIAFPDLLSVKFRIIPFIFEKTMYVDYDLKNNQGKLVSP